MTDLPVVDVHAHHLAPSVVDRVRAGDAAPHVRLTEEGGGVRFSFPTSTTRVVEPGMDDLDDRLRHMDETGVDVQVLSTWIDVFGYDLPEEAAVPWAGWVNEGLAASAATRPDRFRFFATVPLPWGEAAGDVLQDAVDRLGAVGAMIGTNVGGRNLDDPALEPFWARAEALDVPVELHPVAPAGSDRLTGHGLANFLGNPFDTTIAAASLIMGGVLDRHPGLRVVLVHGGGYLPYALGRITHGRTAWGVAGGLAREPREYLDRFHVDTIVYDPDVLRALAGLVGGDRLLLGSDYPFPMEPPDLVAAVRDALGEDGLARTGRNAARLLDRSARPGASPEGDTDAVRA